MKDEQDQATRAMKELHSVFHSSFIIHRSSFLFVFLLFLTAPPANAQTPTSYPVRALAEAARIERLRAHGLSPVPAILTHFLDKGFAPGTRLSDLPATPALKTQIVIDAIAESARQQVVETAPILSRLTMGLPSPGIQAILQWDAAQQRSGDRVAFEIGTLKTLRLNAIVALGLIGPPERVYELAAVFEREKDPSLKIPCALALATMGSRAGLSFLIGEVSRANRTTSVAAAEALKFITGLDYGPGADDPIARREGAAKDWKNWWKHDGKTCRPDRSQILARRLVPAIRPNPREPRTVRELMDRISYPEDPRWTVDSYDAIERLRLMGTDALTGLEAIIADKNANLKIRRQAIILYTQFTTVAYGSRPLVTHQPKRAYKTLWWLRFDRNPEIREVVRQCLARLRQAK